MLALLLAAFTGILFLAPPCTAWALEYGDDDEHFSPGQHDIPVISRQQDPLDRYVRREDDDSTQRQLPPDQSDDFDPIEQCAFVAWPLPAPSELRRAGHVTNRYARGPPSLI